MKIVASEDRDLTVEERNLLSVAYKNVIGARRASWRIVSSIEQTEESKGNDAQVSFFRRSESFRTLTERASLGHDDQGLPREDRGRARKDLRGHPRCS